MINTQLREILNKKPEYRLLTDIEQIEELTKDVSFFIQLKKERGIEAYKQLCARITHLQLYKDDYVMEQGTAGSKFYILLSGSVQVIIQRPRDESPQVISELGAGSSFGDLALRRDMNRSASVQWTTDCDLAVLDKDDYKKILGKLDRSRREFFIELLNKHVIFQAWGRTKQEDFMYCFREWEYKMKQYVYKEGEQASKLYLIKHGTIQMRKLVKIQGKNRILCLGDLGQGEIFGEEDVLSKAPRIYSALCISDKAELVEIPGAEFLKRLRYESQIPIVKSQVHTKIKARENRIRYLKYHLKKDYQSPDNRDTWQLQTFDNTTSSHTRAQSNQSSRSSKQAKFNLSRTANRSSARPQFRINVTSELDQFFTVSPPNRTPMYVSPNARVLRSSKISMSQTFDFEGMVSSPSRQFSQAMKPQSKRTKRRLKPQSARRSVNIHMEKRRRVLGKSKNKLCLGGVFRTFDLGTRTIDTQ